MDSFTLFHRLPFELQDMVWGCYLDPSPQATAHFAGYQTVRYHFFAPPDLSESCSRTKFYRRLPPHGLKGYPHFDRFTIALQTSRRSRQAAFRRLGPNLAKPPDSQDLVLLHEAMHVPIDQRLPPFRIQGSTDLVILTNGMRVADAYTEPTPEDSESRLRYLAFEIPKEFMAGNRRFLMVNHLTLICPSFQVLYAIVNPEVVRQSLDQRKPQYPSFSNCRLHSDQYIAAYRSSRIRPGPFKCGSREYYELPWETVLLEGLYEVCSALNLLWDQCVDEKDRYGVGKEALQRGEGDDTNKGEPKHCRLMTWRDL